MSQKRDIHRLSDMVVEEVSLVDRAANLHRFLVVKRDTPMPKTAPKKTPPKKKKTPPKKKSLLLVQRNPLKILPRLLHC